MVKIDVDDKLLTEIEEYASSGLNIEQIASMMNTSRATLYRLKRDSEKIDTAIKKGRNKSVALVVNKLFDKAMTGDNVAMIFYLKNKDPENWKDKHDHNVTQEIIPDINIHILGKDGKPTQPV